MDLNDGSAQAMYIVVKHHLSVCAINLMLKCQELVKIVSLSIK